MKIINLLFGVVEKRRFLTFKRSQKWERIASYSIRLAGKDPDSAYCGACRHFSAVPDELQKGFCTRSEGKNVVVLTRVTDYCCYFVPRRPLRLETQRLKNMRQVA
jgi:hypothetical protein